MKEDHFQEIKKGERFSFGNNWRKFLSTVDGSRINEAQRSLIQMLETHDFRGKRFLDIGCGSGLFSLAAKQLGAIVHSFDFDPESVTCTRNLKSQFFPTDEGWTIEEASVLDKAYVSSLGGYDIVYSWGVLHHTGDLMQALNNAAIPINHGGLLYIAIYNDQDFISNFWFTVKKTYCANWVGQYLIKLFFIPFFAIQGIAISIAKYKNPLAHFRMYRKRRGMSIYRDWIDWLGGYPFEVAKPEKIFHFYKDKGFELTNLTTTNRLGCNQFVFKKAK